MLHSSLLVTVTAAIAFLGLADRTGRSHRTIGYGTHRQEPQDAASCGACHKAIHDEWQGRAHSNSWVRPAYRAALAKKTRARQCYVCHIPDSVLDRKGRKPRARDVHKDDGISCAACHVHDGKVHGPFGAVTDAHESVKDPTFSEAGSLEFCSGCHSTKIGPVLPLGKDFAKSKAKADGKTCVSCHMPKVERPIANDQDSGEPVGPKRKGRRHMILGPTDPEFAARAFELAAKKHDGGLSITLTNAAGHRIPGLILRTFKVTLQQVDQAGVVLAEEVLEVHHENPLVVDETKRLERELAPGAVAVRVVVDHLFEGVKINQVLDRKIEL